MAKEGVGSHAQDVPRQEMLDLKPLQTGGRLGDNESHHEHLCYRVDSDCDAQTQVVDAEASSAQNPVECVAGAGQGTCSRESHSFAAFVKEQSEELPPVSLRLGFTKPLNIDNDPVWIIEVENPAQGGAQEEFDSCNVELLCMAPREWTL